MLEEQFSSESTQILAVADCRRLYFCGRNAGLRRFSPGSGATIAASMGWNSTKTWHDGRRGIKFGTSIACNLIAV
jgi:hypothetical protein